MSERTDDTVQTKAAENAEGDTDSDLVDEPTDTSSGSRDADPTGDATVSDDVPAADAEDGDAPADRSDPTALDPDVSVEEIEAERAERLAPENRPEGAEVDNTQREFDAETGMFTDDEEYAHAEHKFPAAGEQGA